MVIAENVVIGNDNVLSLTRIIDVITLGLDSGRKSGDPISIMGMKLVIMLKAGDARGDFRLDLVSEGPKAKKREIAVVPMSLLGDNPLMGPNIITPFFILWEGAGVYWLKLQHEGVLIAKTPVHIIIDPNGKSQMMVGDRVVLK